MFSLNRCQLQRLLVLAFPWQRAYNHLYPILVWPGLHSMSLLWLVWNLPGHFDGWLFRAQIHTTAFITSLSYIQPARKISLTNSHRHTSISSGPSLSPLYPAFTKCPNSGFIAQWRYNPRPPNIHTLKLKIKVHFNNVIISSSNLINPSLRSNRIAGVRIAYLIPVSSLNLPSSMLPSWLFSIHKIRSRGDCDDGPGISSLPELIPMLRFYLLILGLEG